MHAQRAQHLEVVRLLHGAMQQLFADLGNALGLAGLQHVHGAGAGNAGRIGRKALVHLPREPLPARVPVRHGHPLQRPLLRQDVDHAPVGELGHREVRDAVERALVVGEAGQFLAGLREEPQVALGALAPRDVHADAGDGRGLAARIDEELAARLHPVHAAVRPHDAIFDVLALAPRDGVAHALHHVLPVLRMDHPLVFPGLRRRRAWRQPVDLRHAGPPGDLAVRQVHLPDPHAADVERQLQALLAGPHGLGEEPQPLLGLLLLGAVAQDLHEAGHGARLAAQRHQLAGGPEAAAVAAQVPALVGGLAGALGLRHLALDGADREVLGREDAMQGLPGHCFVGPAQDAPGPFVPADHPPGAVGADDGVVDGALHDLPVVAIQVGRGQWTIRHGARRVSRTA